LEVASNWAQALAKFERVAEVRFTPQVRFHIARCKEHLGRLTEALGDYRISEYEAERDGLTELGEIARARADLEARLPRLTIVRGAGADRATVDLDGVEIGQASIGTELGLDPGHHQVTAKSPGRVPFEHQFVAVEGERHEVRVELGSPLSAPADPMPESRHHPDEAEAAALDPVPDALATPRRDTDFTPWILSGVAVVSAGAGVFFVVRRADAIGEQRRYCTGGVCNGDYQRQVTAA
jgi:hypothetical protein